MVLEIFKKWPIDKKNSFFIGDQKVDEKCATKSDIYFEYAKKNLFKQVKQIIKI